MLLSEDKTTPYDSAVALSSYDPVSNADAVSPFWEGVVESLTGPQSFLGVAKSYMEGESLSVLTEEQWRQSPYYREGIEYHSGLSEYEAANLAEVRDRQVQLDLMMSEADTLDTAAFMAGNLAGGIVDPLNVTSGAVAAAAMGPLGVVVPWLKRSENALSTGMKLRQAAKLGAAEGVIGAGITEPLYMSAAEKLQVDYGWEDSAMNIATSAAFGGLVEFGGAYFRNRTDKIAQVRLGEEAAAMSANILEQGKVADPESISLVMKAEELTSLETQRQALEAEYNGHVSMLDSETKFKESLRFEAENIIESIIPARKYGIYEGDYDAPIYSIVSALDTIRAGEGAVDNRRILSFIKENGGLIKDAQGEIAALNVDSRTLPGLLSNKGKTLDQMREVAAENGILPDDSTVNDLLDLIGEAVNSPAKREYSQNVHDAEKFLSEVGVDSRSAIENYNGPETMEVKELKRESSNMLKQSADRDGLSEIRNQIRMNQNKMSEIDISISDLKKSLQSAIEPEDWLATGQQDYAALQTKLAQKDIPLSQKYADIQAQIDSIDPETAPREWADIDAEYVKSTTNLDAYIECSTGLRGRPNGG